MKIFATIILAALAACNRESSPEGRLSLRSEKLERKVDSLMIQNKVILDSLSVVSLELNQLKKNLSQSKE